MKKKSKKIKKAVLPVAGFGTRFLPVTRAQPKEMLPLVDKPVIQYLVEECLESGIEEIIFITGRNKRAIEDHFDYAPELEEMLLKKGMFEEIRKFEELRNKLNFIYIRQDRQLGNGHALLCAKRAIGEDPFVFCNGDDLMLGGEPAIKQLMEEYNKNEIVEDMIGVIEVSESQIGKCGVVKPMHPERKMQRVFEIESIIEKPDINKAPSRLANPGRYILSSDIFKALTQTKLGIGGELWISDAFNTLGKTKTVYACKLEGRRFDCGNKLEYLKAVFECAKNHEDIGADFREWIRNESAKIGS